MYYYLINYYFVIYLCLNTWKYMIFSRLLPFHSIFYISYTSVVTVQLATYIATRATIQYHVLQITLSAVTELSSSNISSCTSQSAVIKVMLGRSYEHLLTLINIKLETNKSQIKMKIFFTITVWNIWHWNSLAKKFLTHKNSVNVQRKYFHFNKNIGAVL